jgi:hypothetical protein
MVIGVNMPITFHTWTGYDRAIGSTRGIGFYGLQGSGSTLAPGEWNRSTYIVEGDPRVPEAQIDCVTYTNESSGMVFGETPLPLTEIPNHQATINIRFTQNTAVKVLNARCNLYDGVNTDLPPYGWNARMAEILHPDKTQVAGGDGDSTWHVASTGQMVSLRNNPGPTGAFYERYSSSGFYRHDWFVALSASPEQVGSKTAGLNVYLEYL